MTMSVVAPTNDACVSGTSPNRLGTAPGWGCNWPVNGSGRPATVSSAMTMSQQAPAQGLAAPVERNHLRSIMLALLAAPTVSGEVRVLTSSMKNLGIAVLAPMNLLANEYAITSLMT